MTDLTDEQLNHIEACLPLLPEPGPEVAAELVAEVRRLRDGIREHQKHAEQTDCLHDCGSCAGSDYALWALLDQENTDG